MYDGMRGWWFGIFVGFLRVRIGNVVLNLVFDWKHGGGYWELWLDIVY